MSSPPRSSSSSSGRTISQTDPITRNALRYTISAREYELLHQYLISRAPILRERAPQPVKKEKRSDDGASTTEEEAIDYNAATVRITLRLFLSTYTGLKLWDMITTTLARRKTGKTPPKSKIPFIESPAFRLSLSLSLILFLHRTLHRFFHRLRASLLEASSRAFRIRNPRTTHVLTSHLTPAIGAATLSSSALAIAPASQTRLSIAIYVLSRALEFSYNALPTNGLLKRHKPTWFGSWLLMPLACGQLLHAFVFDRDCFPAAYGDFILRRSPEYIHVRPAHFPTSTATQPWPSTTTVVSALAQASRLRWPKHASPILYPNASTTALLPPGLAPIAPLTSPAHPSITRLTCAILHPHDPSCGRTYLRYFLAAFPSMTKFFTLVYGLFALLRWRAFASDPAQELNAFAKRVLKSSVFITGAIGSAWGSVCFFQRLLPGSVLATQRWFWGGFVAGLWAWLERDGGRGTFLYSARASADSLWKVGVKRRWWKGVRGGDVLVFMASMAVIGAVYERSPESVTGGVVRKSLGIARGEGWVDRATAGERKGKGRARDTNRAEDEKEE